MEENLVFGEITKQIVLLLYVIPRFKSFGKNLEIVRIYVGRMCHVFKVIYIQMMPNESWGNV